MSFKYLRKVISIVVITTFFFTNTNISYASPSSRSLFKNKKVDYDKINNQSKDILEKKQSILKGEDAKEVQSQEKEAKKILSSHLHDISQIHIPQELGRIVEVHQGTRDSLEETTPLIVGIQDLHTNPEAELNLAKILELLLKDYNMGLVCSEGADGKVDTSSISSFPDSDIRERVARIFINSGELTGEEYLSITKYPDLPIWGIETKDIYFKNIIDFNKIMKFNPSSQVFISQTKKAIEALKPKIYSKDLLDLDKKESEFTSQKLDTAKYIEYLSNFTKKLNIPMSNYKNISLLTETMEMEKTIDQLKMMNNSQSLLLNLQSTLQSKSLKNDLDSLMARANLFKDQKISPFSFYSYLKDLATKHLKEEFSAKYPALNSFVDYLTKVNSLDSTKLFTELEDLNFDIKESLSKTDEQKSLVKSSHNINFLENFFNLKVSNEDLDYYLDNKDSHKVAFFKDFLPKTLKKYNINAFIDYNPALIDNHLQELEDFYKVVKDRDVAMVNNSLSEITKRGVKLATLIHGGFHTKGITKFLREKNYSYIIISPYSKTDMDEENYHFLLSGRRKPIEEILKKEFDLPKIVNKFTKTLRVNLLFCATGIQDALANLLRQELGVEAETTAEIVERIRAAIGTALAERGGPQDVITIESYPSGEAGAVILVFTGENWRLAFRVTSSKVQKVNEADYRAGTGQQIEAAAVKADLGSQKIPSASERITALAHKIFPDGVKNILAVRALQYGLSRGHPELINWLSAVLKDEGLSVNPDTELVILDSVIEAENILARLLIERDRGDIIVYQEGSLSEADKNMYEYYGAKLVELKDIDSVDLTRVKFIQVLSDKKEGGAALSEQERGNLLDLAKKNNLLLVEDGRYRDPVLSTQGSLIAMAEKQGLKDRVVQIRDLSPIFGKDVELGCIYVVLPAAPLDRGEYIEGLAGKFEATKASTTLCPNPLTQVFIYKELVRQYGDRKKPAVALETAVEEPELSGWLMKMLSYYGETVVLSEIRRILKVTARRDVTSLAGGIPAPELFPYKETEELIADFTADEWKVALASSPAQGLERLRTALSRRLSRENNMELAARDILVTQGSQEALDLLGWMAKTISSERPDRENAVVTQDPTYLGVMVAIRPYGCRLDKSTSYDLNSDEGLERLYQDLKAKRARGEALPAVIYVMPTNENPTGDTMTLNQRKRLLEIANEFEIVIFEDNPYGALIYDGEGPPPTLLELSKDYDKVKVVYLGTSSKVFAPIRIGWAVTRDEEIMAKLVKHKEATTGGANSFNQLLISKFFETGYVDDHIKMLIEVYRQRRDAMLAALEKHMPKGVGIKWVRPKGGFFIELTFPEGMNAREIYEEASEVGREVSITIDGEARTQLRKVAYVPEDVFFTYPEGGLNKARLSFPTNPPNIIDASIQVIAKIVSERLEANRVAGRDAAAGHDSDERIKEILRIIEENEFLKANTPLELIERIKGNKNQQGIVLNVLIMIVGHYNWVTKTYINQPGLKPENRVSIITEVQNDIYKPMIGCLEKISKRIEQGDLTPNAATLKLSEKDQVAPKVNIGRKAKISFLPMKGDPWQVGHIWSILSMLADGSDTVVIMLDNSDPDRKPDLTALPIRMADSQLLLDALAPFVIYERFHEERRPLLTVDGESVIPTIIYFNSEIAEQVVWQYMAGYDHFNWTVEKKDKVYLDVPYKLYLDAVRLLETGVSANIYARFNRRESDSKDIAGDVRNKTAAINALARAYIIDYYAELASSLADQTGNASFKQSIYQWRDKKIDEIKKEMLSTPQQVQIFEDNYSQGKAALDITQDKNINVKRWLERFESATAWPEEEAITVGFIPLLKQAVSKGDIDSLEKVVNSAISTVSVHFEVIEKVSMDFEVVEQPMDTSSTNVRKNGELHTVLLPFAHSIIGLQRYPAFVNDVVKSSDIAIATEVIAGLVDLKSMPHEGTQIERATLLSHLGNIAGYVDIDILLKRLNDRLLAGDIESIIFSEGDFVATIRGKLNNAYGNALHAIDSYLMNFLLKEDMFKLLLEKTQNESRAMQFIDSIRNALIRDRANQIVAQARETRLAEKIGLEMVKEDTTVVPGRVVEMIKGLTDALKNIGLADLDTLSLEIIKQCPKDMALETLSFMVSSDGLWIVGPEQEEGSQIFIRISSNKQAEVSDAISKVVKVSGAEFISEEVNVGNVTRISISANEPYARREMIRQVVANLITDREDITEGLSFSKPAYLITPLMERFIFGAQLEKKYLDGFKKAAEEARQKYPKLVELYEHMTDPSKRHIPFKLEIPTELFSELNIDKIVAMWIKDAPLATAGLRKGSNPLAFFDASADMNMLLSLFIGNELAEMALRTAKEQGIDTINAIVAGETRYNTNFNNEMLARRFAAMGVIVHRPKPGTLLSIGATSFITTLMDIKFTIFDTASHSARATFASKVMGNLKQLASPFLKKAFGILGIDVKKYEMARSEGAQLLIEDMKALAENFRVRVQRCKDEGEPLVIEFAAGDDERIRFDIENETHPENIPVIARFVKYLKEGYVTPANIEAVQSALINGMKVGFDMASGCATKFFKGVFEGVFGDKYAGKVVWTATVPDSYFKDTGMTDFNPKQLIENNLIKKYAGNMQKELEAFFGTLPVAYTLVATISRKDFAEKLNKTVEELVQISGLGDKFKKQEEINIRFRIFAKEEEGFLKRFGLPYIHLNNGNLLGCYNADLYDLSQDVSLLQVVVNSKLPAFMLEKPIGYIHKTTDPDADRYVALQVERNNEETKKRLERLGIGYIVLSAEKILAVYVPNQTFFQLQYAYIKQLIEGEKLKLKQTGSKLMQDINDKNTITYFEIKTTVSSAAWDALCKFFGIPVVQVPVGFKEIGAIMRKVEEQNKENEMRRILGLDPVMVVVHDILGNSIELGYNPRLLFAGEESGGMIVGSENLLTTEDGLRQYLSWREKNALEASSLMFIMLSKMFNKAREAALARGIDDKSLYDDQQFLDGISLSKQLEIAYHEIGFERYELRADIELADALQMAMVSREKRAEMTREAEARRDGNFAFFLSLAFALEDGYITLNEVKAVLKEVLLSDPKMMELVKSITDDGAEEVLLRQLDDIQSYTFVGDGVYMTFSNGWYEIRPSGTDVKIKSYPSTKEARISAVIANAIGEVYPRVFFEMVEGKPIEGMENTANYILNMQTKDSSLLDREKIITRKQAQYEKGLKVDTMPNWVSEEAIQQLLLQVFPETIRNGTKITSVNIVLGPKSQKEPLVYNEKANRIYVSWAFDDKIKALGDDYGTIATTVREALLKAIVNPPFASLLANNPQIIAKAQQARIERLKAQAHYAEENELWLFAYRRYTELEALSEGANRDEMRQKKEEALARAEEQLGLLGKLALEGLLVSYDGISPDLPDKFLVMMKADGLINVTTNGPLILANLKHFEAEIRELTKTGTYSIEKIYNMVVAQGLVKQAAEKLKSAVESGQIGGVSIEVRSHLSDPVAMLNEAKLLAELVSVDGMVMNKIPATEAGIKAIREAIREGLYPNVTLVFCSHEQLKAVARVIAEGLKLRIEKLHAEGAIDEEIIEELLKFKSFISYFVSRITTELMNDPDVIHAIQEAETGIKKLELLKLVMDAASAFYIDAHEIFLNELRAAGFDELEKLGVSPTLELDASTGEKAVDPDSNFVKALTQGEGALSIDEVAKIILIQYVIKVADSNEIKQFKEGENARFKDLYENWGYYVYRMNRPGSMDTIPIDIYKKIAEGKGAKNVAPMSLEEAKDILKKLEKNFGLNQNKWESIAKKLLDAGVKSFVKAEQDLRIGMLAYAVDEAIEQQNFTYALQLIDGIVIPDVTSKEQLAQIEALRQKVRKEVDFSNYLTKLGGEKMLGQLDALYGKPFEEAKALGASKMARVGFETTRDGKKINRLGWTLANVKWVLEHPDKVQKVLDDAETIRAKYKYIIFCGMGGSGLSVQTVKTTFGEPEGLNIYSLRTTDPAVIKDILEEITRDAGTLEEALRQTLIIPISKSGTTEETVSHKKYFEQLFSDFGIDIADHMWVVTDKGSPMDTGKYEQREIQLNGKGDIGGRFTAPTTNIFLLPLALVAPDRVQAILSTTKIMNEIGDINKDIFVKLGAYLYYMAKELGKDKVTFIVPDGLRDLPMWSEQLFEESLGKDDKGVSIFYGEDISKASLSPTNTNDRVFLRINIGGEKTNDELWRHLEDNGYPVFEITIDDINSIGGVMLGLQRAVATVGYLWDICFVDQPAVEGYKDETRKVMAGLKQGDKVKVPEDWKSVSFNSIKLYYDRLIVAGAFTEKELRAEVQRLGSTMDDAPCVYAAIINILRIKPGFEAKELTSYGRMTEGMRAILQQVRKDIFTDGLKMPSKLGEGPDKNHSYQQNIEGGRDMWFSTYFMPLRVEQPEALPYNDNLIRAQTLGTVNSIVNKGRKVVLVTFDSTTQEAEKDVELFFKAVEAYLQISGFDLKSIRTARQGV